MKNFFESVLEWKSAAALMFSGSVILCAIIMSFMGQRAVPVATLASLLILSSVGTLIQYIAFGNRAIKKLRYTLRMIIFIIPFFALLMINALCFHWFPAENIHSWLLFSLIFVAIFLIMTIGFEIHFRITGKKYDGLLGQYRQRKEQEKK